MSEIDVYAHRCLGIVSCPSQYEPFPRWNRTIPLYRFESDATNEGDSFSAKRGDLLLGGGRGECAAFRVSMPEAFVLTHEEWPSVEEVYASFRASWTLTEAFILGNGFREVGWDPATEEIEFWIVGHVLGFLLHEYRADYEPYIGQRLLEQDGSIFRLPTEEERRIADWKHYR